MKNAIVLLLVSFLTLNCSAHSASSGDKEKNEMKPAKNEDGEWDLTVIDTRFDYFLNAVARPVSQYTESYLKNRNIQLVAEWNSYYSSGRYRNVIESFIDYNPKENYGLKFEYKLYQVFAYVNWRYGLKMNGLSGSDTTRF